MPHFLLHVLELACICQCGTYDIFPHCTGIAIAMSNYAVFPVNQQLHVGSSHTIALVADGGLEIYCCVHFLKWKFMLTRT